MSGTAEALDTVVHRLAASPSVAAIALVGSQARSLAEPDSDLDLFVYTDGGLRELRSQLADELAEPATWRSVHERAFGDGDVWRLKESSGWLDLMYWTTAWGEAELQRVLVEYTASMGYSTAFWRSIREGHPLYERDSWRPDLQQRARQAYPEELRRNIIRLNHPYLRDHPFSYRQQTAKAIDRHDVVSAQHRIVAWLASYFDIVFAINRVLHPGEKRVLEFVSRECQVVPEGMAVAIERLVALAGCAAAPVLETMDELTGRLEALLRREQALDDDAA